MSKLFFAILLLSILSGPVLAADYGFENGIATASVTLSDQTKVNVSVETTDVPNGYVYSKAFMWGGDENASPKKIIKSIAIFKDGQKVFIPLSAYSDLGNPRKISLNKTGNSDFRLVITGGDAAGAYEGVLNFKGDVIYQRKVTSGEFPKEVWEKTIFSFNKLNN